MKVKNFILILSQLMPVSIYASPLNTIISVEEIQKNTEDFFVEGVFEIALQEGNTTPNHINYLYSKIGPTPACGTKEECSPTSESVITFNITGGGLEKRINVNYMCTSIGVYQAFHNGMRDLNCGPNYKLVWTGIKYEINE